MFAILLAFLSAFRARCRRRTQKANAHDTRISAADISRARISGTNGNTTMVANMGGQPRTGVQGYCTCHLQMHQSPAYSCTRHTAIIDLDPVEMMARRTPPPPYVYFIANYDLNLALQQQQQRSNQTSERFPPHPNSVSHHSPHPGTTITVANLVNPTGTNGAAAQSFSPPPSYDEIMHGNRDRSVVSPPPSYELCVNQLLALSNANAASNG